MRPPITPQQAIMLAIRKGYGVRATILREADPAVFIAIENERDEELKQVLATQRQELERISGLSAQEARQILRDIDSLDSHTAFLFDKINFLMDATVGFININQNKIIKIFSVASVALLPPTLIASVYGMNFKYMPELDKTWGYPLALALMLASVAAPFIYFRRKGWLR